MHENSHCFTGTSSQIFDVVSLINFSYSSGNIWLCIMIAHLFVFISTSNFSNSSGQTPRCHPWFLSFFHTSLLLYPQFLLILPSERCHYSSTSYHPTATLVQTVITAYHYQPSPWSPASALVPCSLFLTQETHLRSCQSQLKSPRTSLPSHLEWKPTFFLSSAGPIWSGSMATSCTCFHVV